MKDSSAVEHSLTEGGDRMLNDVFISTVFNICLMVVLATILTKFAFVKRILLNRETEMRGSLETVKRQRILNRISLGLIMGGFCMLSNFIGFQIEGSIPNARVIGVMSAGLLGGPISGLLTAGIGALHRYMGEPERISTLACVLATLLQGVLGSWIWYWKKKNIRYSARFLLITTALAEIVHMLLILLLSRPYGQAVDIVHTIAWPMILVNSIGMILFFGVFRDTFSQADHEVALNVSLSLRTAERCIPYLVGERIRAEDVSQILEIIMMEYACEGAAMVQDYDFVGRTKAFEGISISEDNCPAILTRTYQNQTTVVNTENCAQGNPFAHLYQKYVAIASPIIVDEVHRGCLVMLLKKNAYSSEADKAFISGLADFFTTQIKLSQLEAQKDLRRRAEIQTLQSQINPHFLFNALNTISFFSREKPEKAKELLLALSTYFRNMLQDVDAMITMEMELEHVKAYLMLEEARFEEHLQVEIKADPEALGACRVPNFILQPLVENAVKHGAMMQEYGTVAIHIQKEEAGTRVEIVDNGPGIPPLVIESLYGGEKIQQGIGLLNVQKRLIGIYGEEAGLQVSCNGTSTRVWMVIPNQGRRPA